MARKKNELTTMDVDLAPMLMRPGTNAALVASVIATREIAKQADINDPDSLMKCLQQYIIFCGENNIKITNMSAYAACGVSSADVGNWESGRTRKNDPRYREFALFVKSICAQYREAAMAENLINVAAGIWWQKNYDGFRDDPIVQDANDNGLEVKQDPAEIAEKYRGIVDVGELEGE